GPRRPADPVVRRAVEAAQAAARVPDHPRLDQVFDVFADGGSLWIVSELVPARTLSALLAEAPLSPYRAAEIASDILAALRVLHGHGWVHRNLTARTVLVCEDGRVMLTGLAAGAAEEALCGYDPVPPDPDDGTGGGTAEPPGPPGPAGRIAVTADPEADRRAAIEARTARGLPAAGVEPAGAAPAGPDRRPLDPTAEIRAARAGAIAAYRAGARAAARVQAAQNNGRTPGPGARPAHGAAPQEGTRPPLEGPVPPGGAVPPGGVVPLGGVVPPGGLSSPYPPSPQAGVGTAARGDSGGAGGWDVPAAGAPGPRRGPATALAAERARQARMAVVGPVTERWAPEQAGPVHENWQLAAPIGPATDLWALGALLFRAVQGHAPYPEESTAELVQMVCAEPPAFAEECGPLRPVVESLLRQDPTERIDFEELGGWLRSLVRSAPEPDAGAHVVAAPPADARRLPIIRRRGELVRRRRAGLPSHHARHKRAGQEESSPRRLGRVLLVLVMLGMGAAVAYAMMFMPKTGADGDGRGGSAGQAGPAPEQTPEASSEPGSAGPSAGEDDGPSDGSAETQTTVGPDVADGFTLRKDPEGFHVAVAEGWERSGRNGSGQVLYTHGRFELIVVPGRDSAEGYGSDPMAYQREHERELQPFRNSSWATSTGLKTIEVGGRVMAEGQFTWTGDDGRELFVRNLAMLVDGRYHVVQVRGPEAERDEVTRLFEQASATYRVTD
ncbi:MAG TPA: protein kinase, partial [Streptomyces sp.]|nr:protein kinase [Streptomyces sp.]